MVSRLVQESLFARSGSLRSGGMHIGMSGRSGCFVEEAREDTLLCLIRIPLRVVHIAFAVLIHSVLTLSRRITLISSMPSSSRAGSSVRSAALFVLASFLASDGVNAFFRIGSSPLVTERLEYDYVQEAILPKHAH